MNATPPTPIRINRLGDSLDGAPLIYGNEAGGPFRYAPERVTLTLPVAAVRRPYPGAEAARLTLPFGWRLIAGDIEQPLDDRTSLAWTVAPVGRPITCRPIFDCALLAGGRVIATIEHPIALEIRGQSQVDPQRDAPPFRNSPADLGAVEPRRALFDRTYRPGGTILPGAFFRGLYRDIVFLASGPDARGGGGLCTGMARFTLGCSLEGTHPSGAQARDEVQVRHGRQLTDRALLAAAIQFLSPSPAAAFRRFREQLFDEGRSTVAFDIGIARWDPSPRTYAATLHRLVTQGHTIVPYAFRQADDDTAEVLVYDPSYPGPEDRPGNVLRFDLSRDRYEYRGFGSLARDDETTVLAVEQRPFSRPGTAYLASLVNLGIHPEEAARELRENPAIRKGLVAIAGGALTGLLLLARRRSATA